MLARSGPTVLRTSVRTSVRSLVLALACLLVPTMAAAATKVDDSYSVSLDTGTAADDELKINVPDDRTDPNVDWQVAVTGADGGACDQFGLALLDGGGVPVQVIDGARVDDGRIPVALRVVAAGPGGPLAPGDYRCALRMATGDFSKNVVVKLEVTRPDQAPTTLAPVAPPTTRAAPPTTRPATTTSTTEAPTTTAATTTTEVAVAPVAAPGDGGGPALGGKGPVISAMVAVAVALLLLGGGMLATSGRSPRRIAPPPSGSPGAQPATGPWQPPSAR
jgi:hypothetical protein